MRVMSSITTEAALRALHRAPHERALRKQLDHLDGHCRRFIALSPFVVMATADSDGRVDATPRGGDPGFVEVADDRTLHLPDRPGNNRLDSLTNLTERPEVGLLFMIPGVDETLRVNGVAELRSDPELARPVQGGQPPSRGRRAHHRARGLPALREGAHAVAPVGSGRADRPIGAADDGADDARSDRRRHGGDAG